MEKIAQLLPSCVVWNGDASNVEETIEAQTRIFFTPEIARRDYAAQMPYLFCPGNHDLRGMANRHLERVWMFRDPAERDKWRNDTACTDPNAAGDQLLPTCKGGTPEIPMEVYDKVREQWESFLAARDR